MTRGERCHSDDCAAVDIPLFRMELTERSVSVLLDFLYTGQLCLPSDLVFLLEVAKAADCFHLETVLSWVHGLILANVSEMVAVRRGYHTMTQMALISHLQSLHAIGWPHIRLVTLIFIIIQG